MEHLLETLRAHVRETASLLEGVKQDVKATNAMEVDILAAFERSVHCRTNRRLAFPSNPQTVALLEQQAGRPAL